MLPQEAESPVAVALRTNQTNELLLVQQEEDEEEEQMTSEEEEFNRLRVLEAEARAVFLATCARCCCTSLSSKPRNRSLDIASQGMLLPDHCTLTCA